MEKKLGYDLTKGQYLEHFNKKGLILPKLMEAFIDFTADHLEFSEGFEFLMPDNVGLETYSENPEFISQFEDFAQADGSGSTYAFWRKDKETDLNDSLIVCFGSEGGVAVIAESFQQLLTLLSVDCMPYVDFDEEALGNVSLGFYNETSSEYADDYREWLKENNIEAIEIGDDEAVESILDELKGQYSDALAKVFSKYCEGY